MSKPLKSSPWSLFQAIEGPLQLTHIMRMLGINKHLWLTHAYFFSQTHAKNHFVRQLVELPSLEKQLDWAPPDSSCTLQLDWKSRCNQTLFAGESHFPQAKLYTTWPIHQPCILVPLLDGLSNHQILLLTFYLRIVTSSFYSIRCKVPTSTCDWVDKPIHLPWV